MSDEIKQIRAYVHGYIMTDKKSASLIIKPNSPIPPLRSQRKDQERRIVIKIKDVYKLFALVFRDHTNQMYKPLRDRIKETGICPICNDLIGNKKIQAIHKHGFSRKEIVESIIGENNDVDFEDVVKKYEEIHTKEAIVAIGCQVCHRNYGTTKENSRREIQDHHFVILKTK